MFLFNLCFFWCRSFYCYGHALMSGEWDKSEPLMWVWRVRFEEIALVVGRVNREWCKESLKLL